MQTDFTKIFNDIPTTFSFDQKAFEARWKDLTGANEKMMSIGLETASKTTDIATKSAHETFANLRELTKARSEPQDYMQALTDFAQAQFGVAQAAAESFTVVTKDASTEVTEIATNVGEDAIADVTKAAEKTAEKAASESKAAAKKA
ncbi:Phasin protein [Roseivivax lentus]|uniref:Phasin protein n=1 Tax=Roseivivax lentus TaxID=633194 RepID=A0A1N7NQQ4_9RHOB|nr:phasin family protein [Roseivivax lentus]SIT00622.1 Phasin protein [Roseivivax lentus]